MLRAATPRHKFVCGSNRHGQNAHALGFRRCGARQMRVPAKNTGHRWLWTLSLALMLSGGGYYGWAWYLGDRAAAQIQTSRQRPPAPVPVPVQAAKPEIADVPIY